MTSNLQGMSLVATGATLFAFVAVPVKLVQEDMPSLLLIELRALIQAAIGLVGVCIVGLRPWEPKSELKWLVLWGLNYWLYVFTYYQALHVLPLGDAITLVYLGPIFGSLVARATLGEPLPCSFLPCTLLALAGGVLVSQPSFLFAGKAPAHWTSYVTAIIAAFFGGNIGCISRALPGRHWLELPTVGLSISGLLLTPIAIVVHVASGGWSVAPYVSVHWDSPRLLGFVACIGVGGFVAIVFQIEGYKRANYAAASMLSYSEIPIAYLLQWLFFGEMVTILGAIGSCLVLVAMLASAIMNKKSMKSDDNIIQESTAEGYDGGAKYEQLQGHAAEGGVEEEAGQHSPGGAV